jgi:uncharacterized protein (TIGR02444 family)
MSEPTSLGSASLWNWAVETYARPGVKDALLALQDEHGVDVPLLLWRLWLAERGLEPEFLALQTALALSEEWTAGVVEPLRVARTTLKAPPPGVPAEAALELRRAVLEIEIRAEKLQLETLETLPARSVDGGSGRESGGLLRVLESFPPLRHAPRTALNHLAGLLDGR